MAAGLRKAGRHRVYATPTGAAPNTRRRIMYSGFRKTALSPPAFSSARLSHHHSVKTDLKEGRKH